MQLITDRGAPVGLVPATGRTDGGERVMLGMGLGETWLVLGRPLAKAQTGLEVAYDDSAGERSQTPACHKIS